MNFWRLFLALSFSVASALMALVSVVGEPVQQSSGGLLAILNGPMGVALLLGTSALAGALASIYIRMATRRSSSKKVER